MTKNLLKFQSNHGRLLYIKPRLWCYSQSIIILKYIDIVLKNILKVFLFKKSLAISVGPLLFSFYFSATGKKYLNKCWGMNLLEFVLCWFSLTKASRHDYYFFWMKIYSCKFGKNTKFNIKPTLIELINAHINCIVELIDNVHEIPYLSIPELSSNQI